MKKIIATVLAMVMALALCTVAFADVAATGYDVKKAADNSDIAGATANAITTTAASTTTKDGKLEKESLVRISGDYPKSIAILPDNATLVSLNHDSNEIRTFTVNHEHKTVLMKNAPVKIDKPNSIVIHKLS